MKTETFYVCMEDGAQFAYDAADAERIGITVDDMAQLVTGCGVDKPVRCAVTLRTWTAALQSELLAECTTTILGPSGPSFTTNWNAVPAVKCRLMVASWEMVDADGAALTAVDRQRLGANAMAKVDNIIALHTYPNLGTLPDFERALQALLQAKRGELQAQPDSPIAEKPTKP